MIKLDTTKVYYLGDLSDEQLEELRKESKINKLNTELISYDDFGKCWLNTFHHYISKTNALTLFETNKNERIAQIQLRIQELNNELIELDEEMRKLTYDKKED